MGDAFMIEDLRAADRDSAVWLLEQASQECERMTGARFLMSPERLVRENLMIVAKEGVMIRGLAVVRTDPPGRRKIAILYVAPVYRRRGVGGLLLAEVSRRFAAERPWAIVHEANSESRELFLSAGYAEGAPPRPGSRYRVWDLL